MPTAPLNWLFLDLNSYFASVEQETRPELRGRPIAVVPVTAETTCCIAVSYEARTYGVRTGISVREARRLCPHIELVESRPKLYVETHHRILAAIEKWLPVNTVLSCDEFNCRLMGSQREIKRATELTSQIKRAIRQDVGSTLRCSIGIGPNRLLAKVAAGMLKPDGLMVIAREHLPHALYCLDLGDVPGVGRRMEPKLQQAGIRTVRELCELSRERMASLWGGVIGERMWLELRGEDLPETASQPLQTVMRQHILPPDQRTREAARQTALKMLHDCVRKLRRNNLWAGGVGVAVYYMHHDHAFQADCRVSPCQDGLTLQQNFLQLWEGSPNHVPEAVCVFLTHVEPTRTSDLFLTRENTSHAAVADAMEKIQRRFGKDAVHLGSVHGAQDAAPTRISFGPPPPLEDF